MIVGLRLRAGLACRLESLDFTLLKVSRLMSSL